MAKVKVKLPNGLVFEDEEAEVLKACKAFGEDPSAGGWKYYSQSKKMYVHISEMDTQYLCNALLKRHKENLEKLNRKNHGEVLLALTAPLDPSEAFMLQELKERLSKDA